MVRIEEAGADEAATVRQHGRVNGSGSGSAPQVQARPVVRGQPVGQGDRPVGQGERSRVSSGGRVSRPGSVRGQHIGGLERTLITNLAGGPVSGGNIIVLETSVSGSGVGAGSRVFAFATADANGEGFSHGVAAPKLVFDSKPRSPVVQTLNVSLEMLFTGGTISSCVRSEATDSVLGPLEQERMKTFEVEILPGYKHGTQIKFDKCFPDDELYPGEPKVDVTFIIEEEKHAVFKRKGVHIYADIRLNQEQLAAETFELQLQLLSGNTEQIQGSRGSCRHGQTRTLKGLGMPVRRSGQGTSEYGDLILRFTWPLSLRAQSQQCCTVS